MALEIATVASKAAFVEEAFQRIEAHGLECLNERDRFAVALAGGNTPKAINRLWAERSTLEWKKVVILFGDERCVPPGHPDSNYGMTEETLLSALSERPTVHRMAGEDPDPEHAALDYETILRTSLGSEGRLDLAVLGLGPDGHTASLFPGAAVLGETKRTCVTTPAPDGKLQRLTLTVPMLKRARRILFLAAGADKAEMVLTLVEGGLAEHDYPAQFFIRDESLDVTLLLDEASAAKLKRNA